MIRASGTDRLQAGIHAGAAAPYWPDVLRLAVAANILVGISRVHQHFGFLGVFRPALLAFVVAVAWALLFPRSIVWRNLSETWTPKALAALAACAILSIPFGIAPGAAADRFLGGYAQTLVLTILMIVAIRDWRDLRFMAVSFTGAMGVLALLALFAFDFTAVGDLERLGFGYTYDGNDVAAIMVMGIPLVILSTLVVGVWMRIVGLGVLAAALIVVASTASRGGFVGFVAVAGALLVIVRHIPTWLKFAAVGLFAAAIGLAAPVGYWDQMKTIVHPGEDYNILSEDGRVQIMKRGAGIMIRYPLFGVGLRNFSRADGTISSKSSAAMAGDRIKWSAAHNTYLEVGAEMGIPALLIWLSVISAGTIGLLMRRDRMPRDWRTGDEEQRFLYLMATYLPVTYIGFAVTTLFLSFAANPPFYIFFAFLTGLHILIQRRLSDERRQARPAVALPIPVSRGTRLWRHRRRELADPVVGRL